MQLVVPHTVGVGEFYLRDVNGLTFVANLVQQCDTRMVGRSFQDVTRAPAEERDSSSIRDLSERARRITENVLGPFDDRDPSRIDLKDSAKKTHVIGVGTSLPNGMCRIACSRVDVR
jgi:hypothetical protein